MANAFQDQANSSLNKADAFLNSSRMMLRNDLIFVSALADAISAVKNLLQGYLYTQIARKPPGTAPQSWQEAAAGNSTPNLLSACKEAGLHLPGELERKFKQLNSERNYRTHDNPRRLINYARAQEAIAVAEEVHQRVLVALGMITAQAKSAPAPLTTPAAVPASTGVATPSAPPVPVAVAATPPPGVTLGGDVLEEREDDLSPATTEHGSGVRRFVGVFWRVAAVLLLLLVGAAAGVGIMIPVASGHAPSWLGFTARLLPTPSAAIATPTAVPAATATAASTATTTARATATAVPTGPIILGTVTVSTPVCGAGRATLQLHNTGTAPVQWAIGSPEATAPMFALAAGSTPDATIFGTLASTSEVTIYISGNFPVVLTTNGGTVQLTPPTC